MDKHLLAQRLLTAWVDLLGSDLPKQLKDADAVMDAVQYVQPPFAGFDPAAVTVKNAEEKVTELAAVIAQESAFDEARRRARTAVALSVLAAAAEVLPDVLAKVQPRLTAAVEKLTQAVGMLPENPTSDALVAAGPVAVQAFADAKDAERELDAIDRWASSLSELSGFRGEPVLRLLTPTTREAMQTLLRAKDKTGPLKPLWIAGVNTPDVAWVVNTPEQSQEIKRVLDQMPPSEYKKPTFLKFA